MALYLVRHGQTDWNLERRLQSRTDVALNQTGLTQAQAMRTELRRRRIDFAAAVCSPLGRAVQTARIIVADNGLEVRLEPRFVELDLGEYEGMLETDLLRRLGSSYAQWRALHFTVAAPGGETISAVAERVRDTLFELGRSTLGSHVLIVGHQGVNAAMMAALSGRSDPASIASFKQANDEIEVWDFASRRRIEKLKVVL